MFVNMFSIPIVITVIHMIISVVHPQFIHSDDEHAEKCASMDTIFETCIAYGYTPIWIKCALRNFEVHHLESSGIDGVTNQNVHQVRPGMDMTKTSKNRSNIPRNNKKKPAIGNAPRKSASELREEMDKARNSETDGAAVAKRKRRELVSPTREEAKRRRREVTSLVKQDEKERKRRETKAKYTKIVDTLTAKEKKGCKGVEKKIKKNCAAETMYSCVNLEESLVNRKSRMAVGAASFSEHDDPLVPEAIRRVITEFRRRAYTSGSMAPDETIIIGEVDEVTSQVVSGMRYEVTINLGITDNPICKANTQNGFVAYKRCPDLDSLGKVMLFVVMQAWSDIQWKWYDLEDMEGPPLREKYWEM